MEEILASSGALDLVKAQQVETGTGNTSIMEATSGVDEEMLKDEPAPPPSPPWYMDKPPAVKEDIEGE